MKRAILSRAISVMVLPAMFGLVMGCGAAPAAPITSPPADTAAPPSPVATTPASIPARQSATETPTNPPPTQSTSATRGMTPEAAASAVPTATTLPTPTLRPPATSAPTAEPTADPSVVQAEIADFTLPDIAIPAGATVIWTNLDGPFHTTTSGKDGISAQTADVSWDSSGLAMGKSFSVTFLQPGVFPYTCLFHPSMNATVTVDASSGGETSGAGGGRSGGGDGY